MNTPNDKPTQAQGTTLETIQAWSRQQLESAFSQREYQLGQALDQIVELTRQRDVFFARVKALESAAAVPKPEEAK